MYHVTVTFCEKIIEWIVNDSKILRFFQTMGSTDLILNEFSNSIIFSMHGLGLELPIADSAALSHALTIFVSDSQKRFLIVKT